LYVHAVGFWHTIDWSLTAMQLSPFWQSDDARQATWQMPQVHTKEPPQSLLRMQVPPTSIFFGEVQPAASHAVLITKPKTRCQNADISILRGCFRYFAMKMLGTGGAGMLGLIWNPVWGGWL
jgi:hypothetical protein